MNSFLRIVPLFIVACSASVASAQLPSLSVPDAVGVNIHFTVAQPGEFEMLADGGFKWVRMDCQWQQIETKPGEYDFSKWDRLLDDCDKHHVRALLIFDYSNKLYDRGQSPQSDEAVAAFAKWAAATVTHFKGRHVLWEMYNEPNGFWRPKPEVQQYIKLALATGKTVKAAQPDELFIGPALSGTDAKWLEPCFKSGLLEYWDAVSVHPYGKSFPEHRVATYQNVRALIDKYKPAGKTIPMLAGEWGYSDIWPNMGKDNQGKFLAREFLFNISENIPLTIWYDWHDDGTKPGDQEHHFGTVENAYHAGRDPVYDPKPAYLAAKTLTHELAGTAFTKRLKLDRDDDFVLQFADGNQARFAAWSTDGKPHDVVLPIHSGIYAVTTLLGEKQQPITADEKGLPITLTDSPQYLVQQQPTAS
jgi:hypothetical protein